MKTMEEVNPSEISFTERAAMRTQCRKLAKFMKVKQARDAYLGPQEDAVIITVGLKTLQTQEALTTTPKQSTVPLHSSGSISNGSLTKSD